MTDICQVYFVILYILLVLTQSVLVSVCLSVVRLYWMGRGILTRWTSTVWPM